jgi:hypothetical protein
VNLDRLIAQDAFESTFLSECSRCLTVLPIVQGCNSARCNLVFCGATPCCLCLLRPNLPVVKLACAASQWHVVHNGTARNDTSHNGSFHNGTSVAAPSRWTIAVLEALPSSMLPAAEWLLRERNGQRGCGSIVGWAGCRLQAAGCRLRAASCEVRIFASIDVCVVSCVADGGRRTNGFPTWRRQS